MTAPILSVWILIGLLCTSPDRCARIPDQQFTTLDACRTAVAEQGEQRGALRVEGYCARSVPVYQTLNTPAQP